MADSSHLWQKLNFDCVDLLNKHHKLQKRLAVVEEKDMPASREDNKVDMSEKRFTELEKAVQEAKTHVAEQQLVIDQLMMDKLKLRQKLDRETAEKAVMRKHIAKLEQKHATTLASISDLSGQIANQP